MRLHLVTGPLAHMCPNISSHHILGFSFISYVKVDRCYALVGVCLTLRSRLTRNCNSLTINIAYGILLCFSLDW